MKDDVKKKLLLSVIFIFFILFLYLKQEIPDRNEINKQYKNLQKSENAQCINYLRAVNSYPNWRVCLFASLIFAIIISFYLSLLLNSKIRIKNGILWSFFWVVLLATYTLISELLSYWNWHYIIGNNIYVP